MTHPTEPRVEAPELLPCPFCGGEARIKDYGRGRVGVQCANPDCRAHGLLSLPGEDAISAWNTRTAAEAASRAREDALREALEAAADRLERAAYIISDERLTTLADLFFGFADQARAASTGASQ